MAKVGIYWQAVWIAYISTIHAQPTVFDQVRELPCKSVRIPRQQGDMRDTVSILLLIRPMTKQRLAKKSSSTCQKNPVLFIHDNQSLIHQHQIRCNERLMNTCGRPHGIVSHLLTVQIKIAAKYTLNAATRFFSI